ncbi:MAG: amino acid adenylation domain-containing protein [Bacteroidales bacterium]|nr:amino acid adenylation domain-containing protein [Bacteroidales bacterium]
MKNIQDFIFRIKDLGVTIKLKNEDLKIAAPKNVLTPDIVNDIKRLKLDIIDFLKRSSEGVYDSYTLLKPALKKDYYPLSSAQKRQYVLQQMDLDSISYNISHTIKLGNDINKNKIEEVFHQLIARHESFRTSFEVRDEVPVQCVHEKVEFKIEEFSIEKTNMKSARNKFIQAFNLSKAPLLRAAIVEGKEERSFLIIDMHHIISDGVSLDILEQEFQSLYLGKELSHLSLQYKDYSEWQNSLEQQENVKKQEDYWLKKFSDEIPVVNLPLDYSRPHIQSYEGATVSFVLSKNETKSLMSLVKENGLTLYMGILTVYTILLSKLSGQEDIVLGCPIAGRNYPDLENIVGMFVNTLAIRNEVRGDETIKEFISRLKQTTLESFENQDFQFEDLVDKLGVRRDTSRNPIFDVTFNLLNQTENNGTINEDIDSSHKKGTSKFDLNLTAIEFDNNIFLNLEYSTRLFKEETIDRFIVFFKQIVDQLVKKPEIKISEIDILSEEEKHQLLYEFNNTKAEYPKDKTIDQLFEEQVEKTPDNIALVYGNQLLTYKELNERSNQFARYLIDLNGYESEIIGILYEPSIELYIGIFGILKSGKTYLPIDNSLPDSRIQFILQDSCIETIFTGDTTKEFLSHKNICINNVYTNDMNSLASSDLGELVQPSYAAYIIYTSGSTGLPKGTLVENRSLVNLCFGHNEFYKINSKDRISKYAGFGFDASVWELFPGLIVGASLYVIDENIKIDSQSLNEYFHKQDITISFLPTQFCENFIEYENNSLRLLLTGGDKLNSFTKREYKLYNNYGPTENTVVTTRFEVQKLENNIPIGKPIENSQVYILDIYNQLQPIGVSGELCVSGEGLAIAYLNNPELTEEKFIEHPFKEGERLYRTGDLARWLPDGNIEFLGRIDHQVKIRGFRIELGEIESTLLKHENIKESVVLAIEKNNEKCLCAYIVCKEELNHEELRSYISAQLPDYMIPSYFVELESLPLNVNGKVNRKVLPSPEIKAGDDYVAPSNETEEKLVKIWSDVLNIDKKDISVNTKFFSIGGHSLKATVLTSKIHKEIGVEFPLRDVFLHSTIKSQASHIERSTKKKFVSIPKAQEQSNYPLSPAQKRMYLLQELELESTAYNMPYIISLGTEADKEKIEEAFRQLIKRHESFRTSFEIEGEEPVQRIHEEVEFTVEEYTITKEEVQQKRHQFIQAFDLSKAPLLRVSKVNVKGGGSLLMIDMHHIISDGKSHEILEKDFYKLLEGRDLEPLQLHYKDFSEWQNSPEQQERIKGQESYWLDKYSGEIPILDLPADYPRPAIQEYEGASIRFVLSKEETENIRAFAKENDITLYMSVLSIFTLLLSKLSGQNDIIVGSPIVDRKHSDLENIVGLFLNTLAIRNEVKEDNTIKEFVARLRQNVLDAFENQEYQFEELVENISIGRDLSRNPLIDVMFNLLNHIDFSKNQEIEDTKNIYSEGNVKFDLYLRGWEHRSNIVLIFEYRKKLFNKETISKFIDYFKILTDQVALNQQKKISTISLLSIEDRKIKIEKFNEIITDPEIEELTIQEIIRRSFRNNQDKIAIKDENGEISYKELQNRYTAIAMHISNLGIKEGSLIGVYSNDRVEVISIILGIIHARCVFVPLDANFPVNRILSMVEQVQLNWIIVGEGMDRVFQQNQNNLTDTQFINLNNEIYNTNWKSGIKLEYLPSDPLYIYYTSGSTGVPKAILGKNNSLAHFIKWEISEFSICHTYNFSQLTNPGFDVFLRDIFAPLVAGGSICIPNEGIQLNGEKLIDWIEKSDVTLMHCVPSVFRQMNKVELNSGRINGLKYILLAGEKIIPFELKKWYEIFEERIQLVNIYGPTETTLAKSSYRIKIEDISRQYIPIKPIKGSRFIVLDKNQNICPTGISGEIYIRTPYKTLGYYDVNGNEKMSFIQNPFSENPDDLVYKTGDIGKEVKGECIELLGRHDNQVKIRGFRIELGEIENVLLKYENVKECIIIVRGEGDDRYLCAYVVLGQKEYENDFRSYLTDLLPEYMVPSCIVEIESLPLTANGKVNYKALPLPQVKADHNYVGPASETEEKVVAIWSRILNIPITEISVLADFFELGGHSLKVLNVVSAIKTEFGISLPLMHIYKASNIQAIAKDIMANKFVSIDYEIYNDKNKENIFCFPPMIGYGLCFAEVARLIPEYCFHSFNYVENIDLVNYYANKILEIDNQSSYRLMGYSAGCKLVSLVAKELEQRGKVVSDVILIDGLWNEKDLEKMQSLKEEEIEKSLDFFIDSTYEQMKKINLDSLMDQVRRKIVGYNSFLRNITKFEIINANIHFIHSQWHEENRKETLGKVQSMKEYTNNHFSLYPGNGSHFEMLFPVHIETNVKIISDILKKK